MHLCILLIQYNIMLLKLQGLCSCCLNRMIIILLTIASVESIAPRHCGEIIMLVVTRIIPQSSEVWLDWFHAKECHSHEYRTAGAIQSKVKSKESVCCWFMCDYTAECCTVAIRGPEPPTGARGLLQTAKSYERVSTFCNRKCDRGVHPATHANQKKKALGIEMSCEQLGSTTEHLRGDIDSLQCF